MRSWLTMGLAFGGICWGVAAAPFQDGDVVVFFGDSITHGGRYHEFIGDFYRTRYPDAKIRFVNAGVGGDTASGAFRRIPDDILPHHPTHVAFHFGMNDINRGAYTESPRTGDLQARAAAMTYWEQSLANLTAQVRKVAPQARQIYMTTTLYDDTAVVTNMPRGTTGWASVNQVGCNGGLAQMAGWVLNKARADKALGIDLYSPLNAFLKRHQKTDPHFMVTRWDRVHPETLGHSILAWTFLKAQGVSPVVSDVAVDAAKGTVVREGNAQVDAVAKTSDGVTFAVHARALPFPIPPEALPYVAEFDVEKTLNRETLVVSGLAEGRYVLRIDGTDVGTWTSAELAAGISLGFNSKTPHYRQAQAVFARQAALTQRECGTRNCHSARWFFQPQTNVDDIPAFKAWFESYQKEKGKNASYFAQFVPGYLEYWPKHEEIRADLAREQEAIRADARPRREVYSCVRVK